MAYDDGQEMKETKEDIRNSRDMLEKAENQEDLAHDDEQDLKETKKDIKYSYVILE